MKKKIGTLKGHPIVDGDINLVRYPEIHYNNLRARTFKVEGIEHKLDSEDSQDEVTYIAIAAFPVNVIVPENTMAISIFDSVTSNESDILINAKEYFQGDIIPSDTTIIVQSLTPEIIFIETFENPPFSLHSKGIGVYEETTAKDLLNTINSIIDKPFQYLVLLHFTTEEGFFEKKLENDTIIKEYSVVALSNNPTVQSSYSLKLNNIFKKKINEFNIR